MPIPNATQLDLAARALVGEPHLIDVLCRSVKVLANQDPLTSAHVQPEWQELLALLRSASRFRLHARDGRDEETVVSLAIENR